MVTVPVPGRGRVAVLGVALIAALAAGWLREEHLVALGELIGLEELEEGEGAAEDAA